MTAQRGKFIWLGVPLEFAANVVILVQNSNDGQSFYIDEDSDFHVLLILSITIFFWDNN